jgi:hypothetical protein
MMSAPTAGRRLPALGCLLLTLAALSLSGCGSGDEQTPTAAAGQRPKAAPVAKPCPAGVGAFLRSLDALRERLAVGLSYEQYAARVRRLRAGYREIPIDRLPLDCLATTGTPAESAFNRYIDAANAWGECLADAACATATIEPVLQRKWRVASHFLAEAQ